MKSRENPLDGVHGGTQESKPGTLVEKLERIIEQDPSNPAALHSLGVALSQRGDYDRAASVITQAIALRPNIAAYHVNLAEAYRNLGNLARAVSCCRLALKLWPEYLDAFFTMALALQGMGRREEAAHYFEKILLLKPDMVAVHNNLGIICQDAGNLDKAIEHFKRASELDPGLTQVRTNLGLALLRQDRHEESLHQFQEAARLNPDSAAMHHNLGNVLRLLGRASEARAAYMTALQIDPDYAISHYHIGLSLKNEGKLAEALPWYKLAIEIDTENPLLWQHLAELYVEREESGEALFCWERVRALAPCMNVGIHLGMGSALQDEGRLREAMEHYVEAAKLQPESPPIHIKIGGVYEELGQMTEAEAEFRLALSLQPNFVPALARLGTLLRDKLPDADLLAIEARLGDTELQDNQRARLLFSLAHVLDASGNYARAAACLREANSLTLLTTSEHRKYDPSDHSRFIEQIKLCFNHEFFQMIKNSGLKSRCPVFVVGLPRSGTTLVEQILASHPLVHGAGELSLSRQTFSSIPDVVGKHGPPLDRIVNLKGDDIRSLAEGHLDKLRALDGGSAERIIDKLPDNYIYLGILSAMFPDAVFINCRRQYRDVAVSCWMTDFRSIRWANDIGHIASRFKEYHSLMGHWREVLPSPIHAVDYEELVSDFEGTARCLLDFCGLDWDPACLEYYRTSRIVRTASVTQVRKPIYTRSVDRWKNYESDLSDLFQLLQF